MLIFFLLSAFFFFSSFFFSSAWEISLQEAEREYEENETGIKSIVGKVFGASTKVNSETTSVKKLEHKS